MGDVTVAVLVPGVPGVTDNEAGAGHVNPAGHVVALNENVLAPQASSLFVTVIV